MAAATATRGSAVPGDDGSWAAACPQGQRAQGRQLAAPPPRTNKAARRAGRGWGGGSRGHSPGGGRERAGLAPSGDRGGPGLRTEGALATERGRREQRPRRGPGAPLRGTGLRAGLDSAAARCRNQSAGAGSGVRRPGQRRRRLSLLLPGSLFPRFLLLAGSPPPPQPRRFSGFSSPSRPGRPAGTIPESEGLLPFPAAVGGHL